MRSQKYRQLRNNHAKHLLVLEFVAIADIILFTFLAVAYRHETATVLLFGHLALLYIFLYWVVRAARRKAST